MRGRLLIGAAALLGAMGLASEAKAQPREAPIPTGCSAVRDDARANQRNRPRLELLRRAADRQDCDDDIIALIDRLLGTVPKNDAPADATTATNSTPGNSTGQVQTAEVTTTVPNSDPRRAPPSRRQLTIGQSAAGQLSSTSAVDTESNVPYDLWWFRAPAGESLQVSMTSPDGGLDTYLVVGRMTSDGQFQNIALNDDRGDGTLNSLVCFTPREPGEYVVRARSFWQQQYGSYNLLVQPASALRRQAAARELTVGEESPGRLGCDSAVDTTDNVAYDLWSFHAEAGQVLQISMNSEELDPLISLGQMRGDQFVQLATDDDSGDGLNSLLRFIPEATGDYYIRARTYQPEQYGGYQLMIQSTALTSTEQQRIAQRQNGWVIPGQIAAESATPYRDFQFEAQRNKSYTVRAISDEFLPLVDIGQLGANGQLTPVDFFGRDERTSNIAQIPANRSGGQYIVRVSVPPGGSGNFQVIISENQ